MTDRELRKLKRAELLELMLEQSREIERLSAQVASLQAQLDERKLVLEEAGSIAEAALRLNGIFEAAQAAADEYVANVRRLAEGQEA